MFRVFGCDVNVDGDIDIVDVWLLLVDDVVGIFVEYYFVKFKILDFFVLLYVIVFDMYVNVGVVVVCLL